MEHLIKDSNPCPTNTHLYQTNEYPNFTSTRKWPVTSLSNIKF
jgi:hypothetical protein